jgi:TRAP-type C4-dicarboxylate transport system permease small subunit
MLIQDIPFIIDYMTLTIAFILLVFICIEKFS